MTITPGSSDNTAALQALFDSITPGSAVALPPGPILFSALLTLPAVNHVNFYGNGSELIYTGPAGAGDLITLGTTVPTGLSVGEWSVYDLTILSNVKLTAGAAFRANDLCDSVFYNPTLGGNILGNANLWTGGHFNGGNSITLVGGRARGQNAALIVNGDPNVQFTDFLLTGGIVLVQSGTGLVVGGNVGGLSVDQAAILENGINVAIDNSQVNVANSQLFFGPLAAIDKTLGDPGQGIVINDPGGPLSYLTLNGTWISSASSLGLAAGYNVRWVIQITGGTIIDCGYGIVLESPNVELQATGTAIRNSAGYGIMNLLGNPMVELSAMRYANNAAGNTYGLPTSPN